VTATDGVANIVVGGTTFTLAQMLAFGTTNGVVNTGEGTLRLTGYNAGTGVVSYSYTLNATIDNDSYAGATPTGFDDSVTLTVNGIGGTTASDNLVVHIVDDTPTLGTVQSQQTDNNVATHQRWARSTMCRAPMAPDRWSSTPTPPALPLVVTIW